VLIARAVAPSLRVALGAAPLIGVLGLGAAFAVAHHRDLPPGQVFTALLGVVALLARGLSRR
jgi:ABC-type Mn2+/Zn2+ transport system permease subunit